MQIQSSIHKIAKVGHAVTSAAISLVFTSVPPLHARTRQTSSTCRPVKALAKQLTKKGAQASLDLTESPASKYWRDAPQGIYLDLVSRNVAFNDRSMLSDARRIISLCPGVVAVRFSQYGSDWGPVYELVSGKVRNFSCSSGMGPENRPFKWGSECNA